MPGLLYAPNPTQKLILIILTVVIVVIVCVVTLISHTEFRAGLEEIPSLKPQPGETQDSVKAKLANYESYLEIKSTISNHLYNLLVKDFIKPVFELLIKAFLVFILGITLAHAISQRFTSNKP